MTLNGSPRHSVSVAGVVVDDAGRALMVQRRDNGKWEPPGGVLELDEEFAEGVRREVLEETGLEVKVEQLTGVYKNLAHGIVALVFRCRPRRGTLATGHETVALRWMTATEIREYVDETFAVRVHDALSGSGTPALRHHDGIHILA